MTNKNLNWKTKPFLLRPAGKDYLWGGTRLREDFGKDIDMTPLAETWECSTHPDGPSIVASGAYEGMSLKEVIEQNPQYLGTHPRTKDELPILIKFIDAKKDLSVQVHPDDEYALVHENGSLGKTEMWYVLDADKDAKIVYGFERDLDANTIRKSLEKGTIEKYLQRVEVQKDDVFYIEAGTVHAIGAGSLIAEIQENSNLTYRLYDYDRVDKNGERRPLQIDKALEVANFHASKEPKQPLRVLKYKRGCASEFLCRCKYFQVERYLINSGKEQLEIPFRTEENSFQVLLCTEGAGSLMDEDGDVIAIQRGDCIFVPANSEELHLMGKMQLLVVGC